MCVAPSHLQAGLFLDFILAEIAPSVYNAAISDAQTYLRDRVADLEGGLLHSRIRLLAEGDGAAAVPVILAPVR